jgi:hypothetical protein
MRDITVPIGTSSTWAISAYVGERIECPLQVRVERRAGKDLLRRLPGRARAGRLLDGFTVHLNWIPAVVPPHVPKRIVEDGEQPRLQVRPALELMCRTERLQVRVLDEILRIRRTAGQAQGGPIQAVDMGERGQRKLRFRPAIRGGAQRAAGRAAESHEDLRKSAH